MNKIKLSLTYFLLIGATAIAQVKTFNTIENTSADGKYKYLTVSNDPLKVRKYVLTNGLTVLMSVNKKEPRIQTLIATKAGSKNDPAENTGLAHYLEHMLFKGTDQFGSKDWEKEKIQLDKIDALYEIYNKTSDENSRKTIYHQIDSVSGVASKYAIANEYDKLMQTLGAQGTNAFTSLEQTVYVNDIPQNNLQRWLTVEAERFRNPILRLFHTELEAVYEEKNIGLDDDENKMFEALLANLFRKHSYGTQTTIGTIEHLKNPSLLKIRAYYNTYYVPNNMAIILAGDFDPDETIKWIDEKFSYMQPKPLPNFKVSSEDKNPTPIQVDIYGPDAESMMLGYRLPGASTREALILQMCDMILANAKAGLIDLNLTKKQLLLSASSSYWINKDYSIEFLSAKPKQGQTLDDVKELLLQQIDKLKNGEFDESLLKSIVSNLKVMKIEERKSNQGRAYSILESFILDRGWENSVSDLDEMSKISKTEIMQFANNYFTNDCVLIYKHIGEDKSIVKVPKPEISPVEVNRNDVSAFVTTIKNTTSETIKPKFIDYSKDLTISTFKKQIPVYYVKNNDNDLFQLYYVLDMGKWHDLKLPIAVSLLEYLGTSKLSSEDLSKEFYKLACDFNVFVSDEQVYVSLSGLNENFDAALKLFENLLANAKPDQQALNSLVERTLKSRIDAKLNKGIVFRRALQQYAIYGKNNPFTYNLNESQLKDLKVEELVSYIKNLSSYKHTVYYFGSKTNEQVNTSLQKFHTSSSNLKDYPKPVEFERNETKENTVFFTHYNMVQAEIMWINKSHLTFDSTAVANTQMFNEYFGGGMSSLVFQTIRESKALAYSTYSHYQSPSKKDNPYYILAYVGTQADKINEAIPAMNELLNNMPRVDANFQSAKISIKNTIETQRINDESIIWNYEAAKKLGVHHDLREDVYKKIDKMTYEDIQKFYSENFIGIPYFYCIMASKDKINLDDLKKYGLLKELSLEEIFGY